MNIYKPFRKAFVWALVCMLLLPAMVSAENVDAMASQILGAQQVDEVLSSFGQGIATDDAAATDEDAAVQDETPEGAEAEMADGEEAEPEATQAPSVSGMFGADIFLYSIAPILPENQYSDSGSFDLRMEPGQKQTVYVELMNEGTTDIVINVSVGAAYSNQNGAIEYLKIGEPERTDGQDFDVIDSFELSEIVITPEQQAILDTITAPLAFHEVVSVPERKLHLAPREVVQVPIEIEMPAEPFEGMIMGGITFVREPMASEMVERGMGIVHLYSYIIGMRLHESDSDEKVVFQIDSIEPNARRSAGNSMVVNINNPFPLAERDASIRIDLYHEGDRTEAIAVGGTSMAEFAPSSVMPYAFQTERLADGRYEVVVVITTADGEEQRFEETVVVGDPDAVPEPTAEPTPEPEASEGPAVLWLEEDTATDEAQETGDAPAEEEAAE